MSTATLSAPPVSDQDELLCRIICARLDMERNESPRFSPADKNYTGQLIYETFMDEDGCSIIDVISQAFTDRARKAGVVVEDEDGDLQPWVLSCVDAVTYEAIWYGLTAGAEKLGLPLHVPRRLMPPGYGDA